MKSRRSALSVTTNRKTIDARGKLLKEGATWFAECIELDCGGRGRTVRQAIAGFEKSLRFHFEDEANELPPKVKVGDPITVVTHLELSVTTKVNVPTTPRWKQIES